MMEILERQLAGHVFADVTLLDAVVRRADGCSQITLFFDSLVAHEDIVPPVGAVLKFHNALSGASILSFEAPSQAELAFAICGVKHRLTCGKAEWARFKGRNVLAAIRNGESAGIVSDWLHHHVMHHGLDGAVIVDRAKPGTDGAFAQELKASLAQKAPGCQVVIVSSQLPLGRPDLPAESDPYCVRTAPGRKRMIPPDPSPWNSPMGVASIYEILRTRFLAQARAVANIDVHDLLIPAESSVFDTAVAAKGGLVTLMGRHCYPWRVRANSDVHFADHICVQFDSTSGRRRWCIAPASAPANAVWRPVRIGNAVPDRARTMFFYRHMSLRHPTVSIAKLVPKASLIEHPPLLEMSVDQWGHKPVRMPKLEAEVPKDGRGRCAIVTTMKNEGPFILEWLAYHRVVGFDDIFVYTNDCTDGTDTLLDLLQSKGIVQHRDNSSHDIKLKPQHAALRSAEREMEINEAAWITCIDVDEYVNIKCGDGTLDALFAAAPNANMISMTWRLFGNDDIHHFEDRPVIEQFVRCAPEFIRKPHQAWGFKTLFRNLGFFRKLGVHRPKGLNPQFWEEIKWVNGSGRAMPRTIYRTGWRSTVDTYGYDLVQLNHYAARSAESFLVKRDRGRVNHVDRDQGLGYWFRMNNNSVEDRSIARMLPRVRAELARLLSDPEIATAHAHCVACHQARIAELKAVEDYASLYDDLTGPRLEKLSRLHGHFGANVFLSGPGVIPDEVLARDPDEEWFFTVEPEDEHRG